MTTINLLTQGQQLINTSKVVIASGDVDSVQLHVKFDSAAWGSYPTRSATFYTSNNPTVHEMLLVDDKCIVPFEVLTESCVLFIGVRGVSSDGEKVKTSTLVKYKISEGATAGDKTLKPTMDLYQQYLAALKNEATPVIAAIKEEVKASIESEIRALRTEAETTNEAARAMASELERTVLWENPNPTAEFAATTIKMDLSAFKSFRVVYFMYAESAETNYKHAFGEQIISVKNFKYFISENGNQYRHITISDTGITISDHENANTGTTSNGNYVPVQILGYKY